MPLRFKSPRNKRWAFLVERMQRDGIMGPQNELREAASGRMMPFGAFDQRT